MTQTSDDDSTTDTTPDVSVINKETASRYEAHIGDDLVGLTNYRLEDDRVVFTHAEVYPRWEGQGVGSALARGALDDVVKRGKLITPLCPFIADFVRQNPTYLDHVDAEHRAELADSGDDMTG